MFWHNFKYSLKTLIKNKILLFWTFIFPLILGLFFNLAFSDIEKSEKLDIINIAIINNENFTNNKIYKETFSSLSNENSKDQLFTITYTDEENAKKLLEDDDITGYINFSNDDVLITVNTSGINETILKYVVDEIKSNQDLIENLITDEITNEISTGNKNPDYEKITQDIVNYVTNIKISTNDISNSNLSYTMVEYYTLIAMSCLYGGILSMYVLNKKLANMDSVGKRTSISPISKGKMIIGSLCASYLTQLIGLAILFLFTIFVLHVDYGTKVDLIIILACIGSLSGLSIGIFISSMLKTNENTKTGILIAITMFCCFLSGMMGITMKYTIDKNIPILNMINPANMITDGLYSLYYYNSLNRYYFNLFSLLIFSLLLIFISFLSLRRQKYDSI